MMEIVKRLKAKTINGIPTGQVELEPPTDIELISLYASIALYEYEENPNFPHGNPLDNFRGILGELAFRQCLRELGLKDNIDFEYVARKLNYWAEGKPKPYDFKLKDGKTIEIATVKSFHKYCVIKETSWKRSDYAVAVKIEQLECYAEIYWEGKYQWFKIDAEHDKPIPITDKDMIEALNVFEIKPSGKAMVKGYGTLNEIDKLINGWQFGKRGTAPTTEYDGRYIELDKMHPISELWEIIKPSKTKPKTGTLDAYRQKRKR